MGNFRELVLSSGLLIFGGKNAENNDELVRAARPKDVLVHTSEPGSPFCNVGATPSKKDVKEAAVFCAKYSQAWRDRKGDVVVDIFKRGDMDKSRKMKPGMWAVKKKETVTVKKSAILKFEEALSF